MKVAKHHIFDGVITFGFTFMKISDNFMDIFFLAALAVTYLLTY